MSFSDVGDMNQTRPMPTCTQPEPLEFQAQILGIIPQAGPLPKDSSPNSNPSHLHSLPPELYGYLIFYGTLKFKVVEITYLKVPSGIR